MPDVTLGDLLADRPAARVLDRFGLDYCCHGDTMDDACGHERRRTLRPGA